MAVQPPPDADDPNERARLAMENAGRFFDQKEEEEEEVPVGDGLPHHPVALLLRCAIWTFWLGLIVGSVDAVYLAVGLKVPITHLSFMLLGTLSIVCFGVLGAILGFLLGWPLYFLMKRSRPSLFASIHFSTVGLLLFGAFFWTYGMDLWLTGRVVPALVLSGLPFLLWAVLWINALPRMRRVEMGRPTGLPWWLVAPCIALVVLMGSVLAHSQRDTGGTNALDSDPNVVLIAVEGLRADFSQMEGTQGLEGLLSKSVQFENVLIPHPRPLASNTSLLSGLHPVHHGVIRDGDRVKATIETLPRVMKAGGFSTAAFVSSSELVANNGLSLGFYIYDDSLGWPWLGFGQLLLAKLPVWPRGTRVRTDSEVGERFESWLEAHDGSSFLAWIHMRGAVAESLESKEAYSAWLDTWSQSVEQIVDSLKKKDEWDNTLFVIVGTSGHELETSQSTGPRGLSDAMVRVPLVIRYPGDEYAGKRVENQVRSYDLYPTILERLELVAVTEHEGTPLSGYLRGEMEGSMWCPLIGINPAGTGPLLGLRHQGFKYVADTMTDEEWLYDLAEDPDEIDSLVDSQAALLNQVRSTLQLDRAKLDALQGPFFEFSD